MEQWSLNGLQGRKDDLLLIRLQLRERGHQDGGAVQHTCLVKISLRDLLASSDVRVARAKVGSSSSGTSDGIL